MRHFTCMQESSVMCTPNCADTASSVQPHLAQREGVPQVQQAVHVGVREVPEELALGGRLACMCEESLCRGGERCGICKGRRALRLPRPPGRRLLAFDLATSLLRSEPLQAPKLSKELLQFFMLMPWHPNERVQLELHPICSSSGRSGAARRTWCRRARLKHLGILPLLLLLLLNAQEQIAASRGLALRLGSEQQQDGSLMQWWAGGLSMLAAHPLTLPLPKP